MPATRPCLPGVGLVTPIGSDPESFWQSLITGRSGAARIRSFDTSGLPNHIGCEVTEIEVPAEARSAIFGGRCTELAVQAVAQAVENAGLDREALAGATDVAVVVGTTMGEVTQFEEDRLANSDREPDERDVRALAHRPLDVIGRSVARMYGLNGPVVTVPAACAAGAYAIGVAASMIERGAARIALAVGAEAFSRLAFVGFSRMHAMSPDCCRPFSRERQGLLLGEGAGVVVVEAAESAASRGVEPLGFVDGFGLSCDAHHITGPHPGGEGAARAMRDALKRGAIDASAIDYVNAHGTGTPLNDKMESLAVRSVFGEKSDTVPVSSIKALTGHMMGAAGAVEAIASLLAIRHGVIPPTWNWLDDDPDCPVDCVPNAPRERKLNRVLSNSYAFGGNNGSLLLTSASA